jgi:hypothetical protein
VFGGHNHYYARAAVNGVQHITTGGGGAPLYTPNPTYPNVVTATMSLDYCKVEIDSNVFHLTALTPGGQVIDEFTIIRDLLPPQVVLVRPNGGEVFYAGSQDTIKWIATDNVGVDSVNIYYSIDGGATFPYTVATGEPNDSVYVWTVPDTPADSCIVKIEAYDFMESVGEDASDAFFSIRSEISVEPVREVASFGLLGNYPNPFNPMTRIEFTLDETARVYLRIYDVSGKVVKTLVQEAMPAGRHTAVWNGEDESGRTVVSGVYVCRLEASGKMVDRKMVLLK